MVTRIVPLAPLTVPLIGMATGTDALAVVTCRVAWPVSRPRLSATTASVKGLLPTVVLGRDFPTGLGIALFATSGHGTLVALRRSVQPPGKLERVLNLSSGADARARNPSASGLAVAAVKHQWLRVCL